MKNKVSKLICLVLALAALLSLFSIPAFADAPPSISTGSPIKVYAIASSGKIYSYTDSSLRQRGSSWVWAASDECYITATANNGRALYISMPLDSGGRISRWFSYSDFLTRPLDNGSTTKIATAQITTYRHPNPNDRYGYTGTGDIIYILGTIGSYTQLVYPISSGYKAAWVKTTDLQNGSRSVGGSSGAISFNFSSNGSYVSSTSSSVNLRVNGTYVGVGSTFYTYNSSGTRSTGYRGGYRYVSVAGRLVDVGAGQCLAYARYLQILLYGVSEFGASSRFTTVAGASRLNASTAKQYITAAGVGAHIRTKNPHSLFVLAVDGSGFYATDANADWANGIRIIRFSWNGFANSNYANIEYIKAYRG